MLTPTLLIFVVTALLAFALGAAGGYFFYRARHREAMIEIEALEQDLVEREHAVKQLRQQAPRVEPNRTQTEHEYEMTRLREELEQRELDLNILRQDYDVETRILKQELAQLRAAQEAAAVREAADDTQGEALRAARHELAQREAAMEARRATLDEEEQALEAARESLAQQAEKLRAATEHLREHQAQSTPADPTLVKRLRQQVQLQAREIEELRALLATRRTPAQRPPRPAPSQALTLDQWATPAEPDGFPSFSPLSSFATAEGDVLTRLPGLTPAHAAQLHRLGVDRFEQLARWSSADVRRFAEQLGVDRRVIEEQWIIEAQSHLFQQRTA